MKKDLFYLLLFLAPIYLLNGQYLTPQLSENTIFYMEVNGKNINQKVDWQTFNDYIWVKSLYQKSSIDNWRDLSNTGIDYNRTQYHYYNKTDTLSSYVALLPVNNEAELEKFIQVYQAKGIEIQDNSLYKMVSIRDHSYIAWNAKNCIVVTNQILKNKLELEELNRNLELQEIDTLNAPVDTIRVDYIPYPSDIEMSQKAESQRENQYDYTLEKLQQDIDDLQFFEEEIVAELEREKEMIASTEQQLESVKTEIQKLKEKKEYFIEYNKLPYEPTEEIANIENDTLSGTNYPIEDNLSANENLELPEIEILEENIGIDKEYQPNMGEEIFNWDDFERTKAINDSLLFVKKTAMATKIFDSYFQYHSKNESQLIEYQKFKKPDADVYFWFGNYSMDISSQLKNMSKIAKIPSKILMPYLKYFNITEKDIYGNLEFKDDNITLKTNQVHKNKEANKNLKSLYSQKFNSKLFPFISEHDLAFYSLKLNTQAYFNYFYDMLQNLSYTAEDAQFQKSTELILETLKIVIDEKSVAQIAPGNAVFSLHSLLEKEVAYTALEYDDEFNPKEIEKTKKVFTPNFTFAFVTEQPNFWIKTFELLQKLTEPEDFDLKNGVYSIKYSKNEIISELHFTEKNGVTVISSSLEGIKKLNGQYASKPNKNLKKILKNNAVCMRIYLKDISEALTNDEGLSWYSDRRFFQYLNDNLGDIEFKSNYKSGTIENVFQYQINSQHDNSLMYFFNLFEESYLDSNPSAAQKTTF